MDELGRYSRGEWPCLGDRCGVPLKAFTRLWEPERSGISFATFERPGFLPRLHSRDGASFPQILELAPNPVCIGGGRTRRAEV